MTKYDMDPDGVTRGINRFRDAGETFGTAWGKHRDALHSGLAGIGDDPMSQAFRARYTPLAEKFMGAADAIPGHFRNLCDDAQCCVDDYHAADTTGAGIMNGVNGSGMGGTPT